VRPTTISVGWAARVAFISVTRFRK
jgi:hypothetical protein